MNKNNKLYCNKCKIHISKTELIEYNGKCEKCGFIMEKANKNMFYKIHKEVNHEF